MDIQESTELTGDVLASYAARWSGREAADYVYVVPGRGVWCLWEEATRWGNEYTLIEVRAVGPGKVDLFVLVDRDAAEFVFDTFRRALGLRTVTPPTGER